MLVKAEITKIENFIKNYVEQDEEVVVLVSGGLDSDVTARLCCRALGKERVKLCLVHQSDFEKKFCKQATGLAEELGVCFAEVHLENMNRVLVAALEDADKSVFQLNSLLDPAKAKCSLRSAVISCYQDKGYLIAGTTNKTEKMLGFFLTFGDNLANFKPLAHLYKTQVIEIAKEIGTAQEVIAQESSSGFWKGQTDAEDIAYWIINEGPLLSSRNFTDKEVALAESMIPLLTPEYIDYVLSLYEAGKNVEEAVEQIGIRGDIVKGIFSIAKKAPKFKSRKIMAEPEES